MQTDATQHCVHHPTLAASVQCRGCGNFLCRLCVHVENGLDTCRDCNAACRDIVTDNEDDSYYAAVELTQTAKPSMAATSSKKGRAPESVPPPGSAQPPKTPAVPRPMAHLKAPPYFCKNHPHEKATRQCRPCSEEFCNACAKMVEGNPRCPDCGGQINALLPEDQGLPPRGIFQDVADALLFPFRGSGLLMMLFGSVLVFVCNFGGWKSLLFSYAFMYTFGIKICNTSALGRETPPDWPGLGDITNAFYYFVAWFVSQLPAIAYLILIAGMSVSSYVTGSPDDEATPDEVRAMMGGGAQQPLGNHEESQKQALEREEREARIKAAAEQRLKAAKVRLAAKLIPFYVLALLGNLYLPMALLALILYRNYTVLNPLFIASSALKCGTGYLGAVLTFIAADVVRMIPGLCGQALGEIGMLVVPLLAAPLFLYLLMVSMRALGVMYYYNQRKLGWFT